MSRLARPKTADHSKAIESILEIHDSIAPIALTNAVLLPVDLLKPTPSQPRQHISPEDLDTLRESIAQHKSNGRGIAGTGVLVPLVVRWESGAVREDGSVKPGSKVWITDGERRWRAAQAAGCTSLPALIEDASLEQALDYAYVANSEREDLSPLDDAAFLLDRMKKLGLSERALARRYNKNITYVRNRLSLLKTSADVRQMVRERKDSMSAALLIDDVKEPRLRRELIDMVLEGASFQKVQDAIEERGHAASSGHGGLGGYSGAGGLGGHGSAAHQNGGPLAPPSRGLTLTGDGQPATDFRYDSRPVGTGIKTSPGMDLELALDSLTRQAESVVRALQVATLPASYKSKLRKKITHLRALFDQLDALTGEKR